jgi:hypothetical protein
VKSCPGLAALIVLLLNIVSCAGEKVLARLDWEPPPPEPRELALIIDHQSLSQGGELPLWVEVYDENGIQGLETLPEYADSYLFVFKNQGNNFVALQLWLSGAEIANDFSGLIARRVSERFTSASTSYPSFEYDSYFENVVKAAFDAEFTGGVVEARYWLLKRYFKEDGVTTDRDVYEFLLLLRINKALLVTQLNALLDWVTPTPPLTETQANAVLRLRAIFFDEF